MHQRECSLEEALQRGKRELEAGHKEGHAKRESTDFDSVGDTQSKKSRAKGNDGTVHASQGVLCPALRRALVESYGGELFPADRAADPWAEECQAKRDELGREGTRGEREGPGRGESSSAAYLPARIANVQHRFCR